MSMDEPKPRPDRLGVEGARAAVIYLSGVEPRVVIAKELQSLPEAWHHGLKEYTYDEVAWGIREYYGKLAHEKRYDVLSPAMCRKILQGAKAVMEGKQAQMEPPEEKVSAPMPEALKQKLARVGLRP